MGFSNKHQEAAEKLKDLKITQHTWDHTARVWVEREKAPAWGSAFAGIKAGSLSFGGLTL